jgi:hypothetical protein
LLGQRFAEGQIYKKLVSVAIGIREEGAAAQVGAEEE